MGSQQSFAEVARPLSYSRGGGVPGFDVELGAMESGNCLSEGCDSAERVRGKTPTPEGRGDPIADHRAASVQFANPQAREPYAAPVSGIGDGERESCP